MEKYLTPTAERAMNYHRSILNDLNQSQDWYDTINKPEILMLFKPSLMILLN